MPARSGRSAEFIPLRVESRWKRRLSARPRGFPPALLCWGDSLETSKGGWYSPVMTHQFLTDDRGQKVAVVIPMADYESLMEDVADLAAVAERRDDDRISLDELKEQLTADGLLPR